MSKRIVLTTMIVFAAIAAILLPAAARSRPPDSAFSARVDNQWFPLLPGTRYLYNGIKDGRASREILTVTHQIRTIDGVPCVVVRDRLFVRGHLAERTTDWYSQDRQGNVWYFGEDTAELDAQGKVASTEGSWQAGVDGAQPGIFMPTEPRAGQSGRQEFYRGQAEDHYKVIGVFRGVAGGSRTERASHAGDDPARAGRHRPQALRPRHRHRARADREGGRRAQ